jgi:hypothetical protein
MPDKPVEVTLLPLGFEQAAEDWNEAYAGRPMGMADWLQLTFGEQHRYAAQECKTKGANCVSKVCADRIEFTITLPPSLHMVGLTAKDAERIENALHKAAESVIAWELQYRSQLAEIAAEALP